MCCEGLPVFAVQFGVIRWTAKFSLSLFIAVCHQLHFYSYIAVHWATLIHGWWVLLCQGTHIPLLHKHTALGSIKYTWKHILQRCKKHLFPPDVQLSYCLLDLRTGTPSMMWGTHCSQMFESVGRGVSWLCMTSARNRSRGFMLFGKHLKGLWALANLHCSCVFRQQKERGRMERGKRTELRIRTGSFSRGQASLAETIVANGTGCHRIQA